MTKQKSLGQIAYEAEALNTHLLGISWAELYSGYRLNYERMAQAVARAVRRRGKEKK